MENNIIVSGSYDKTVRIFDVLSGNRNAIQVIDGFKDSITTVIVLESEIVVSSLDGCIYTYDIRYSSKLIDHISRPITSISISNDGNCILSSCNDNALRLFDRSNGELLNEYTGHRNSKYQLNSCFSPDDSQVMSGSEDGYIYIWDLVDPKINNKIKASDSVISRIGFHPSGLFFANCVDCTISIWK